MIIRDWLGRHIDLNENLTNALTGDTLIKDSHDYFLLTYIGKDGCTGCKMKLNFWKRYFESLDTIDAEIGFLMVIHPDDSTLVAYMLERDNFDLPVYIDTKDFVNETNSFPADEKFQSFLLDKSNDVIAIGNPTISPKIGNLYRNIMAGNRLISSSDHIDISVPIKSITFDNVSIGDSLKCDFIIENYGPDDINVDQILSSCDCTFATVDSPLIPSKNKCVVSVISVVEDNQNEDFLRTVQVYLKEYATPIQFEISGTIKR